MTEYPEDLDWSSQEFEEEKDEQEDEHEEQEQLTRMFSDDEADMEVVDDAGDAWSLIAHISSCIFEILKFSEILKHLFFLAVTFMTSLITE